MEEKKEGERLIIGGDFNARTGEKGGAVRVEEEIRSGIGRSRISKDKVISRDGRKLIEMLSERG